MYDTSSSPLGTQKRSQPQSLLVDFLVREGGMTGEVYHRVRRRRKWKWRYSRGFFGWLLTAYRAKSEKSARLLQLFTSYFLARRPAVAPRLASIYLSTMILGRGTAYSNFILLLFTIPLAVSSPPGQIPLAAIYPASTENDTDFPPSKGYYNPLLQGGSLLNVSYYTLT